MEQDRGYAHLEELYFEEREKVNYSIKILYEIFDDLKDEDIEEAKYLVWMLLEKLDD